MQFHALAVDYDGTLAHHGQVDGDTVDALQRLKESGRRLLLVTGRRLEPLLEIFPSLEVFDRVVAENGAVIYDPSGDEEQVLADPPGLEFVEALRQKGVTPLDVGRVIVATWSPHETAILETIRDMALELQIIFNKGALMVLPTGVNKALGLRAALKGLKLSPRNTVGVGDAENDEAFLRICEVPVAVENALPAVKARVDLVTHRPRGEGVAELIDQLIDTDLQPLNKKLGKGIELGWDLLGRSVKVPTYGNRVLVIGDPAGGKSKFALSFLERVRELGYTACVIDPEGDYQELRDAIVLGTMKHPPEVEDVARIVEKPNASCVVSLFGAAKKDRAALFARLLRAILDCRSRTGVPHWIVIDEAHYALPATWKPTAELGLGELYNVVLITALPDRLPQQLLQNPGLLVAIGDDPNRSLLKYCETVGQPPPEFGPPEDRKEHHAVAWWAGDGRPFWFQRTHPRGEHRRHKHNYLDGRLEKEHCFYFRGPLQKLNLSAHNVRTFVQLAEGVDDETWLHHLRAGDYERWFQDVIKDDVLAGAARRLEASLSAADSRRAMIGKIHDRYQMGE